MNNNLRVVIDSGHGGTDSGAVGNEIKEKDYTLLISKYMKKRFDELGIPSTLTRNSDETISPSEFPTINIPRLPSLKASAHISLASKSNSLEV